MANYPGFSDEAVQSALAAVRAHGHMVDLADNPEQLSLAASGEFSVHAQCISVTIKDGKICVDLPLHLGSHCLPIPHIIPNGTAAQVCLDICTKYKVPTGVKVTVSALGHVVITKTFGVC